MLNMQTNREENVPEIYKNVPQKYKNVPEWYNSIHNSIRLNIPGHPKNTKKDKKGQTVWSRGRQAAHGSPHIHSEDKLLHSVGEPGA